MHETTVCGQGGFCLIAKDMWGNWIKCSKNENCKTAADTYGNCVLFRECTHVSANNRASSLIMDYAYIHFLKILISIISLTQGSGI